MRRANGVGVACVLAVVAAAAALASTAAAKEAGPRAYVQSGPDGVFYARCVPPAGEGKAGHTDVYQVWGETDKLVDRYDWFARDGVVLGWSPIKGEVAVLAAVGGRGAVGDRAAAAGPADDWRQQEELRFYSAGRHLKTYTSGDLVALGADEVMSTGPRRHHAGFRLAGCEQVPGTNEYDFLVDVGAGKVLRFDITTGGVRSAADRGRARAAAAAAAGRARVLHYGKPWSAGKPLVDDASGLPVEVLGGCAVTAEFCEETDAYNAAARAAAAHPAARPSP
jgi:hypothetical protein